MLVIDPFIRSSLQKARKQARPCSGWTRQEWTNNDARATATVARTKQPMPPPPLLPAPPPQDALSALRDYQRDAHDAMVAALLPDPATRADGDPALQLLEMVCGAGKTITTAHILRSLDQRVHLPGIVVLAELRALVLQLHGVFETAIDHLPVAALLLAVGATLDTTSDNALIVGCQGPHPTGVQCSRLQLAPP